MTRCHYDILGVPLDADAQILRAAYKKCALKWHPDKNLDNVDKAKEEFQLVQQAFEVLSDPHERAWYDTHREAILKGGIGKNYQDDSLILFPYFSSTCYKGYGDDEKGFYAVYREVFHQIYAEDVDYDPDEKPDETIPSFGRSDSSYEEVVHPFYAYWENYCTTKTFVWLDEFDIREAPNRRVMRLMEKENKKLREKAKKQRNEEIRQLIRFVRKRDKRFEKHRKHLAEKAAVNAMKVQINRLRQLEERKREIAETTEADWAKMHNIETELQQIESHLETEFGDHATEEEIDEEDSGCGSSHLFCVACNKIFKNEKSFANHERSKKHKDNVAALNLSVDYDIDDSVEDDIFINPDEEEILSSIEGSPVRQCTHFNSQEANEDQGLVEATSRKKTKSKKVLKPMDESQTNNSEMNSNLDNYGSEDDCFVKSRKQSKKRSKKKNSKVESADTEITVQQNNEAKSEDTQKAPQVVGNTEKTTDKRSKKKQAESQNKNINEASKDLSHTCAVCKGTFPSKNKLFSHLKTTGHSVYLGKAASMIEEKSAKCRHKFS